MIRPEQHIIMTSAIRDGGELKKVREIGPEGCLYKPVVMDQLYGALRESVHSLRRRGAALES